MQKKFLILIFILVQIVFVRLSVSAKDTVAFEKSSIVELPLKVKIIDNVIYLYNGNNELMETIVINPKDTSLINYIKTKQIDSNNMYRTISERDFNNLFPNNKIDEEEILEPTYMDSSQSILDYFYKAVKSLSSNPF